MQGGNPSGGYPGQSAADEKSRDKDRPEEGVVAEEVADPVFEEDCLVSLCSKDTIDTCYVHQTQLGSWFLI